MTSKPDNQKKTKQNTPLNMVKCRDGVVRHWYEAFPRDFETQFAGIEPGCVPKPNREEEK